MRPHPLLAITSAIFVVGAAGAIGDALISTPASALASVHRRVHATHTTTQVHSLVARFAHRSSALVLGSDRTAPLPYFVSSSSRHRRRHTVVQGIGFEVRPSAAASRAQWLALRECESDDNYGEDTGNGYYGAYQFAPTTWWGLGYSGLPDDASAAVQDAAAARLQQSAGWSAWPICSVVAGL